MDITLILECSVYDGSFVMVADEFPFVPRLGDWIVANHVEISLPVNGRNTYTHYQSKAGTPKTIVYMRAETTSRRFAAEEMKRSFRECGMRLLTLEEAGKEYPFFPFGFR